MPAIAQGERPRGVGTDVVAGHHVEVGTGAVDVHPLLGIAGNDVAFRRVAGPVPIGADHVPPGTVANLDGMAPHDAEAVAQGGRAGHVGANVVAGHHVPIRAGSTDQYGVGRIRRNDVALPHIGRVIPVGTDHVGVGAAAQFNALSLIAPVSGARGVGADVVPSHPIMTAAGDFDAVTVELLDAQAMHLVVVGLNLQAIHVRAGRTSIENDLGAEGVGIAAEVGLAVAVDDDAGIRVAQGR